MIFLQYKNRMMEDVINEKPLVSVILCTYNDERYIAETIKSVLYQTFKNFEFIIWNDGSTDGTQSIIKSFKDDRIRYFFHENTGLGVALGLACKEAKGKYIARIDGDDICLPYRLEKEVDFLEKQADYVLVSSSVYYINEEGTIIGRSFPWTWHKCQKKQFSIVHPAAMYRRDAYNSTYGYLNLRACEDRLLWSSLIKKGKFWVIEEPLIKYRLLSTSLSHAYDMQSIYARMLEMMRIKICDGTCPIESDIELHNLLYDYAKNSRLSLSVYTYKQSLEEKLYRLMSKLLGEKISTKIVCTLKNIYCLIRY